jgi:hypothetical protein
MAMRRALTQSDLEILYSIWPRGQLHFGPQGEVFASCGKLSWTLVARHRDGNYVLIEESGRRSTAGTSLAELGLPDAPIAPMPLSARGGPR